MSTPASTSGTSQSAIACGVVGQPRGEILLLPLADAQDDREVGRRPPARIAAIRFGGEARALAAASAPP